MGDRLSYGAVYRRTCPASPLCPWRGPVVWDEQSDDGTDALYEHMGVEHPEAMASSSVLWETWEVVHPTYLRRLAMASRAALALLLVALLLALLELLRRGRLW